MSVKADFLGSQRFVLAEILKHSSIEVEGIVKLLRRARIQPRWNKVKLPQGTRFPPAYFI